jgi:hypothetical protein
VAVTDPQLLRIFEGLRRSGFRELAGARVTATIPIGERLLNETIATLLPQTGAIREASVHPRADNRLGVRVKLTRPEFLPPITATVVIDRQPELPHLPSIAFRVTGIAGLLTLAGPLFSLGSMLPPGVRLDGDLLTVDLAAFLAQRGQKEWLDYVERLRVTSEPGRLVVNADARVRA